MPYKLGEPHELPTPDALPTIESVANSLMVLPAMERDSRRGVDYDKWHYGHNQAMPLADLDLTSLHEVVDRFGFPMADEVGFKVHLRNPDIIRAKLLDKKFNKSVIDAVIGLSQQADEILAPYVPAIESSEGGILLIDDRAYLKNDKTGLPHYEYKWDGSYKDVRNVFNNRLLLLASYPHGTLTAVDGTWVSAHDVVHAGYKRWAAGDVQSTGGITMGVLRENTLNALGMISTIHAAPPRDYGDGLRILYKKALNVYATYKPGEETETGKPEVAVVQLPSLTK